MSNKSMEDYYYKQWKMEIADSDALRVEIKDLKSSRFWWTIAAIAWMAAAFIRPFIEQNC